MKLINDFGVRALFGSIAVGGAVFTLSWIAITQENVSALQMLGDAMIAVIAFYFGQRSNGGKNGSSTNSP